MKGYKRKEVSLKKVIKSVLPSAVLLNDTLLIGNTKVSIEDYTSWVRNRREMGGWGILTAVAKKIQGQYCGGRGGGRRS